MNIGWTELLLILGVALLFFGPSRLPGLGKSLGEAIRGFKKGLDDDSNESKTRDVNQQLSHDNKNQSEIQSQKDKNHQS